MRTFLSPMTITMALALTLAGPMNAAAQDVRVRVQNRLEQRIVIPDELVSQLRQLIETAIGRDLGQQIGREIGRSLIDVTRRLENVRGLAHSFDQGRDFKVEQTDRQTRTLAIGASGELTLKNIVGDITVKTGNGRDVTVEIVRISRGKTDADAKVGLERVRTEIESRGERGSVTVNYPSDLRPDYAVSVAYTVTAPAGTRVTVDTVSGHVRVTGLQGELNANTINGAVDLMSCARVGSVHTISGDITLTDARSDGRIDVGSASAALRLTNIKAQRLTVNVISGLISARDVQAEGASLGSLSGDIEFSGTVVPKGRYEFQAHSGNVKLAITGGFDLEGRTFSGRVEADPALNLTSNVRAGTNDRGRSLRGVAGGGGAAVVATTFSGNVWVGRKLN